jgi:hypothetical protein
MNFNNLATIPVILLGMTSVFLMISQNWRWSIIALALQYLGVFWLVVLVWPFSLAVVKLVAGWMAGAVLSASRPENDLIEDPESGRLNAVFRLIASALVIALILSIQPVISARLPLSPSALEGGLILIGIGLLHLGLTTRPLRVILGLLTVLSGFELVYAGLETSILMAGLLAAITLGLALGGAYLMSTETMEEDV